MHLQIFLLALLWVSTPGQPGQHMTLPPLEYPPRLLNLQFFNTEKGTYMYNYDTGSNNPASFRGERREESGRVSGYYGYIDPDGVLRLTYYAADEMGYRSTTTLRYLRVEDAPPYDYSVEPDAGTIKSN